MRIVGTLAGLGLACAAATLWAQEPRAVIGAENDAAPWSYPDGTGYVNDLVRAAFKAGGWEVRFEVLPYARCKSQVVHGQLVGCFSSSQTSETEKDMVFPKYPVFSAENRLYVNADSALSGCSPAQWGRPISVSIVNEYEYMPAVEALAASQAVRVEKSPSEPAQLRMLSARRFDAAVITTDPIKRISYMAKVAGVKADYKMICDYGALPAYLGFSRKHPQATEALAAFERGMDILQKNGTIKKLQQEWAQHALRTATRAD